MTALRLLLALCLCAPLARAHRLSAPVVLLPFNVGDGGPVNYTLSVHSDQHDVADGCFEWESQRPSAVSVTPIVDGSGTEAAAAGRRCSTRARIGALGKTGTDVTVAVFARDAGGSGESLRCDVILSAVERIEIVARTHKVYLDDAPKEFVLQARNHADDIFTDLAGLPVDWSLRFDKAADAAAPTAGTGGGTMKLVRFADSEYEAPDAIERLEAGGKLGHRVMAVGLATGTATLRAKLAGVGYEAIPSHKIDLIVTENVHLVPSRDTYVPLAAKMRYRALVHRHKKQQEISLPSAKYHLSVSDESVGRLNAATSEVTAVALGRTDVVLKDKNVGVLAKDPPMAHLFVVEPAALRFELARNARSWVLERGKRYDVTAALFDADRHRITVTDNMRIKLDVPAELKRSATSVNGSQFAIRPAEVGAFVLRAAFHAAIDDDGKEIVASGQCSGQQEVVVYEPVEVRPKSLALPLAKGGKYYEYQLKASGGSGSYLWSVADERVAAIGEHSGLLIAKKLGVTKITVSDARAPQHSDTAQLTVTSVRRAAFGPSVVEAETGGRLALNIRAFATDASGAEVEFADCTHETFDVLLDDAGVFAVEKGVAPSPSAHGCSSVSVLALKSGDAKATLSTAAGGPRCEGPMCAAHVSAYEPMRLAEPSESRLLAWGSGTWLGYGGAPRPWILDPSGFYARARPVEPADSAGVTIGRLADGGFYVACANAEPAHSSTVVRVEVGNEPTDTNRWPAASHRDIVVCCGRPEELRLLPRMASLPSPLPACPLAGVDAWRRRAGDKYPVDYASPAAVQLAAYGRCAGGPKGLARFDNVSSLVVGAALDSAGAGLATVEGRVLLAATGNDDSGAPGATVRVVPHSATGDALLTVTVVGYADASCTETNVGAAAECGDGRVGKCCWHTLPTADPVVGASATLRFVRRPAVQPDSVSVYNEPGVQTALQLRPGSGYYHVLVRGGGDAAKGAGDRPFDAVVEGDSIKLTPRRQGTGTLLLYDLCLGPPAVSVPVAVSDLSSLTVAGAHAVDAGGAAELTVCAYLQADRPPVVSVFDKIRLEVRPVADRGFVTVHVHSERARDNCVPVTVTGVRVGADHLVATAHASHRPAVNSAPHPVQVYAPLRLRPHIVDLVVGARFQLESAGGPDGGRHVTYDVNDTSVARAPHGDGLVEAVKVGRALVTATAHAAGDEALKFIEDAAVVRVWPVAGVRIAAPSRTIYEGAELPLVAHVLTAAKGGRPLDPFAFGGVLSPDAAFHLHWSLAQAGAGDAAELVSPWRMANVSEPSANRFSVRLLSRRAARVTITLRLATKGSAHEDSLTVDIVPRLRLLRPAAVPNVGLLLTPAASAALVTNKQSLAVHHYAVVPEGADLFTVDAKTGVLRTGDKTGTAVLLVTVAEAGGANETLAVLVEVLSPAYVMADCGPTVLRAASALAALPLGSTARYTAALYDGGGRRFDAWSDAYRLRGRRHRFDLTGAGAPLPETGAANGTSTAVGAAELSVHSKGDTVIKVWTEGGGAGASLPADFVRLPAGQAIGVRALPPPTDDTIRFVVGDAVCFSAPFLTNDYATPWWTDDSADGGGDASSHSRRPPSKTVGLDARTGLTVMRHAGAAVIAYDDAATGARALLKISVSPVGKVAMGGGASIVSDVPGASYDVHVLLLSAHNDELHSNVIGCADKSLAAVADQLLASRPPFECDIAFDSDDERLAHLAGKIWSVKPAFDADARTHVCRVTPLPVAASDALRAARGVDAELAVKIGARSEQGAVASVSLPYYGQFAVHPASVHLSDAKTPTASVEIVASKPVHDAIKVTVSRPALALASFAPSQEAAGGGGDATVRRYTVRLISNERAADWADLHVDVHCAKSGQTVRVPLAVTIYGSGQFYPASGASLYEIVYIFLVGHEPLIHAFIMVACLLLLVYLCWSMACYAIDRWQGVGADANMSQAVRASPYFNGGAWRSSPVPTANVSRRSSPTAAATSFDASQQSAWLPAAATASNVASPHLWSIPRDGSSPLPPLYKRPVAGAREQHSADEIYYKPS